MTPGTVADLFRGAAAEHGDELALVVDGDELTYAQLLSRSEGVAERLASRGVGPGATVAVVMPNCPEFVMAVGATALLGGRALIVNSRLAPAELRYVLADSGASVVLTVGERVGTVDLVERLGEAVPELVGRADGAAADVTSLPALRDALILGSAGGESRPGWTVVDTAAGPRTCPSAPGEVWPDDDFLILYTSGTTSKPKGCVLTHLSVLRAGLYMARRLGLRRGGAMWNPCPLFHVSGFMPFVGAVAVGSAVVSQRVFGAPARSSSSSATTWTPPTPPSSCSSTRSSPTPGSATNGSPRSGRCSASGRPRA